MELFGQYEGRDVHRIVIGDPAGFHIAVITYAAALTECWAPDRNGHYADVTLGWSTLEDYVNQRGCFGATCGRYANRIAKGRFALNGEVFQLETNEGPTTLHGGPRGFNKHVWSVVDVDPVSVTLEHRSSDGDQGFPGNLVTQVTYRLEKNELQISLTAETDKVTPINLVNHAYWNMAGHVAGDVLDQEFQIFAAHYLPVDGEKIPTGTISPVEGTPFDFRQPKEVGAEIHAAGGYYDHNWCLEGGRDGLSKAAILCDKVSGRRLTISTTEPGIQVYTAAHLDGSLLGKTGTPYPRAAGLALEPQNWPDAPNQAGFPDPLLKPGAIYSHLMSYKFDTE